MRTAIFIRSHRPDIIWLEYCLRSMRKYVTGFEYVTVAVPSHDMPIFYPLSKKHNFKLWTYPVVNQKNMLSSEVALCHVDSICGSVDGVCLFDSDCVWVEPATPLDFTVGGRPVLIGQSFEIMARNKNGGIVWQGMAEKALGWKPTHETMRHPTIYLCETFAPFRAAVEKHTRQRFDDYVLSCQEKWPQTFAELTSLGAFAAKIFPEKYFFADVAVPLLSNTKADSGAPITALKLRQFWSHGGINPKIRDELEAICA